MGTPVAIRVAVTPICFNRSRIKAAVASPSALVPVANGSVQRMQRMMDPTLSGLPKYLTKNEGVNFCSATVPKDWKSFTYDGVEYYYQPLSGQ